MAEQELSEEVQTAVWDIQRYLLDQIPPLTASESVQLMMQQPPVLMMRQINGWALEQGRLQSAAMTDLLYHALKKIYLFASLKLIEKPAIEAYLAKLIPMALQLCPAEDRELLRKNLAALGDTQPVSGAAVDISRAPGAALKPQSATGKVTDVVTRSARRLSLVIDRLARRVPGATAASAPTAAAETASAPLPMETPAAELVSMAAASSSSEQELQQYIEKLKPYTGDTNSENLFRILATSLPAWNILVPPSAGVKAPAPVEAMHKILSLTKNPLENNKRFRDLLMTAVDQFNAGSLSAAASMLELADAVILEKKIDPSTVDRVRLDAVQALNSEQLKKYAENKSKHALLRKVLSSFPALTKESLLADLRGEQRPERRRALLSLLEAYGGEARSAALVELEAELKRSPAEIDTYYLRNVIYLLHRIPRESEDFQKELELLTRASARNQSIYVIKEAVIPLGQMKGDAAVKLLTLRLAEFEALLLRKDTSLYPAQEMQKVLDRTVAALARIGTPAALLTVARHGMKPNPLLGDTRARLSVLSQHDLSFDETTVNLLVKTIREDLPSRILGRVLPRRQAPPLPLIEALSSTRAEVVENLFADIVERFPEHDVGRAAAAALENLASDSTTAAREGTATLTGDLQFFGLPSLMQSLAETQATGIVTLSSKESRQTAGKLLFVGGKFADAQCAQLRGSDALYQLLERPTVGTFSFVPQQPDTVRTRGEPQEVMGLIFEGIRRHGELKQASVMVPDELALKATSSKPTPDPEEKDPAIIRDVWLKASAGAPIRDWEGQIATDAFRVRRLVARWLEEGALQPAG